MGESQRQKVGDHQVKKWRILESKCGRGSREAQCGGAREADVNKLNTIVANLRWSLTRDWGRGRAGPHECPRHRGFRTRAALAASARSPSPQVQLFHFLGQCFLRFASKNPPSNYLPSRAHRGTLPTNALEKKGTDGSFIAHLEMFPRLLFSSPIHSCRIPRICQLESPEAAAGGPSTPRGPARGRALAVALSPAPVGFGCGNASSRGP